MSESQNQPENFRQKSESGYQSLYPSLRDVDITKQSELLLTDKKYLEPPVNAVPAWIPIDGGKLALTVSITFTLLATAYIATQIYAEVVGDPY
jgi:hypothetical protein